MSFHISLMGEFVANKIAQAPIFHCSQNEGKPNLRIFAYFSLSTMHAAYKHSPRLPSPSHKAATGNIIWSSFSKIRQLTLWPHPQSAMADEEQEQLVQEEEDDEEEVNDDEGDDGDNEDGDEDGDDDEVLGTSARKPIVLFYELCVLK